MPISYKAVQLWRRPPPVHCKIRCIKIILSTLKLVHWGSEWTPLNMGRDLRSKVGESNETYLHWSLCTARCRTVFDRVVGKRRSTRFCSNLTKCISTCARFRQHWAYTAEKLLKVFFEAKRHNHYIVFFSEKNKIVFNDKGFWIGRSGSTNGLHS